MKLRCSWLVCATLAVGCAQGGSDSLTSLSGPASPGGGDSTTSGTDSGATTASVDGSTGVGDGGPSTPACCEVSMLPGCGSAATESCVCASLPTCCLDAWTAECVDLAIACGEPACTDPTTGTGPGETSGDPSTSGESDTTGEPLSCDDGFDFFPLNPAPGVAFDARYTDPEGLTWVGLRAIGPAGEVVPGSWIGVEGSGPFTWSHGFEGGLAAGVWTLEFTHRASEDGADMVRASCQRGI